MEFLEVGPNSGADPHVGVLSGEVLDVEFAGESELLNVARFTASEEGVHVKRHVTERLGPVVLEVFFVDIEDLKMFPEIAVSVRDEAHCIHACFEREK